MHSLDGRIPRVAAELTCETHWLLNNTSGSVTEVDFPAMPQLIKMNCSTYCISNSPGKVIIEMIWKTIPFADSFLRSPSFSCTVKSKKSRFIFTDDILLKQPFKFQELKCDH